MGMFDWVNIEVELPDGVDNKLPFQTKHFHCHLGRVTINKEGRLIVPDCFNEDEMRDANMHGSFIFYTMDKDNNWIQFEVTFKEGQLVGFERMEKNW